MVAKVMAQIPYLSFVSYGQACLGFGIVWFLYVLYVSICRLFFHPLRYVPGPKLAALTQWVETYYECFKSPGGQFMWEYQKWHEKYGPIVRISPNEVHIQDARFYDILYSHARHSNKLKHHESRFNNRLSVFAAAEHDVHRMRRAALNPFFSKRKITQHAPNIQRHMDKLCDRVISEFLHNGSILNLSTMWGAFAGDIVVGYCLERPYNFINNPGFHAEFSEATVNLVDSIHFATQFTWMTKGFRFLPNWAMNKISSSMASVNSFNEQMKMQILLAKTLHSSGKNDSGATRSLFTALLDSDLPPHELETERLRQEASIVIGAGVETVAYSLTVCSYHVLSNPVILNRLKAELVTRIKDASQIPSFDTLRQFPYLTCVVNEALRFSYGTTQRMHRLSPTPMTYSHSGVTYYLPVGCVVSMDNYTASHDSWVFGSPYEFRPERWENDPRAPDGKPLTTYLISFGRGTRSCVGMQLAYAELYIGVASFFRRFDCELFETGRDAVDCYQDKFVPRPKPGTKGVRATVLKHA